MKLSRAEQARRKKNVRRRKLILANSVLLAAIIVVAAWNVLSSTAGKDNMAAQPAIANGHQPGPSQSELPQQPSVQTPQPTQEPAKPQLPPENNTNEGVVKLAFVGDVLLGEYVGTLLKQHGTDYPYEHVRAQLQAADLAAANLETAVTAPKEKPGQKTYEFRSEPDTLPAFREAGFSVVNLANNHTLDFGPEGLRDTFRHLKENGIAHVGAGESADEAYEPVYIEKNGVRIAILGFSRVIPFVEWKVGKNKLGLAETYDYTRPVQAIKEAEENADLVVVLVHWGEERSLEPDPIKQTELGRRYIDAGADLVIGSHPHVLQGYEYYKGRWIAYSLGNFIFTKSKDPSTYDSGILEAECVQGGECSLQLTPYRVDTPKPQPMGPEQSAKVLEMLSSLSTGAHVKDTGEIVPDTSAMSEQQ